MIPINWASAGKFIVGRWREIAIGLLLLSVWHLNGRAVHWHDQTEVCQSGRAVDKAKYEKAAADAKAKNLEEVRGIEQKWQGVVTSTQENLNAKLTDALGDVDAYAKRLRFATATNQGGVRNPGLPQAPGSPGDPYGTGSTTLIPVPESDLRICAANTIKAEGWQDFYGSLVKNQTKERVDE